MQRIQEDDILEIVATHLKSKGFRILALGGNQAGRFRFHTRQGRRKAPDLVAYREPLLFIAEAKVKATRLFSRGLQKGSDYDSIKFLCCSKSAQQEIKEEALRVLKSLRIKLPTEFNLLGGLIAGTDLSPWIKCVGDLPITLLSVRAC